jgi:serine/threonine protein kinase
LAGRRERAELLGDPEALSRFRREAQTASALNPPGICTIHDIGEQDGHSFIIIEYLEGATLRIGSPHTADSTVTLS